MRRSDHKFGISRRRFVQSAGVAAASCCLSRAALAGNVKIEGAQSLDQIHCAEIEPFPGTGIGQREYQESLRIALGLDPNLGRLAAAQENLETLKEQTGRDNLAEVQAFFLPQAGPDGAPMAPLAPVPGGGPAFSPLANPVTSIPSSQAEQTETILPQRLALQRAKLWNRDRPVRLAFVNSGPTQIQNDIKQAVELWNSLIDLKLVWDTRSPHIQIGFRYGGFWSFVGTDSLANSLRSQYGGQTLNIQPNATPPGGNFVAVALHEVGHALGAIHEHQSPTATIPWNKSAVYAYYGKAPNNWTQDQVNYQVFQKYSVETTNASAFDRTSIMLYPTPAALLDQRVPGYQAYISPWNLRLSATDVSFMQRNYGGSSSPSTPGGEDRTEPKLGKVSALQPSQAVALKLSQKLDGQLTKYADYAVYKLDISSSGAYIVETVETDPATNVVLELFAESNLNTPLRKEAYGGRNILNARIVEDLKSGTYYVRAAHRNNAGTGKYTIYFHSN